MNAFLKHPWRVTGRLFWLAGELALSFLDFVINVLFKPKVPLVRARAQWFQQTCRRILRILDVTIKTEGSIPLKGLVVCNHLSYLDILVIGTITPSVFIAKNEVKRWPVFGWFAQLSGTLFIKRTRRADVARLNQEVEYVLDAGGLVVLFPEGTSSDGRNVLPFKSSLLEPVTRLHHPLTVAFLDYSMPDGDVRTDVCYWGNMTFAPHLVNLFSKRRLEARVSFTALDDRAQSRKELARHLHSHVIRLKESVREDALA